MHTLTLSLAQLELLQDLCDRDWSLRIWHIERSTELWVSVTVECPDTVVTWLALH